MAVVSLKQKDHSEVVKTLEGILARAQAGMIDGFLMVEIGRDNPVAPVTTRLSSAYGSDAVAALALVGTLDLLKNEVLEELKSDD